MMSLVDPVFDEDPEVKVPNKCQALLGRLSHFVKSLLARSSDRPQGSLAETQPLRSSQPSYASTEMGRLLVNPVQGDLEASEA